MLYCDKCGHLWQGAIKGIIDGNEDKQRCDVCNSLLKKVPDEYFQDDEFNAKWHGSVSDEMEQKLIKDLVFTSPNFDQYYFDHKDEIASQQRLRDMTILQQDKNISHGVTCPYCGSTNISKIGTINRAVSVGLLGLASSKIGKTHKCNKCGSTW